LNMTRLNSTTVPPTALVSVLALVWSMSVSLNAADFTGIGFLHPNDNESYANAVSADGSVVAGLSFQNYTQECPTPGIEYRSTYRRGFVWSQDDGMLALEDNSSRDQLGYDEIYDVSSGGETVFGASFGALQHYCGTPVGTYDALGRFEWTPTGGPIATEQGTYKDVFGRDSTIYAGSQSVLSYWGARMAFRHTPASGIQTLGWLPWGNARIDDFHGPHSRSTGISADGSVVVGNSTSAASYAERDETIDFRVDANQPPINMSAIYDVEAFRWTEDSGMVGLGDLPGGDFGSVATGVSGDGQTVIGRSAIENDSAGFRWTAATGMVAVGGLLPGYSSELTAISFDGTRIVGSSTSSFVLIPDDYGGRVQAERSAIIWDNEHGVRNLKDVLESEYGLNLAGWQLYSATDISADGRTIVGIGSNPLGQTEGWVARLTPIPEPASALSAAFALSGIWLFVRAARTSGRTATAGRYV
jgi:uncharacterized membrane protein